MHNFSSYFLVKSELYYAYISYILKSPSENPRRVFFLISKICPPADAPGAVGLEAWSCVPPTSCGQLSGQNVSARSICVTFERQKRNSILLFPPGGAQGHSVGPQQVGYSASALGVLLGLTCSALEAAKNLSSRFLALQGLSENLKPESTWHYSDLILPTLPVVS